MNEKRQGEGVFIDKPNPQPSWRKRALVGSHDNLICLAGKLEEDILCGFCRNREGEVGLSMIQYFPKPHDDREKRSA